MVQFECNQGAKAFIGNTFAGVVIVWVFVVTCLIFGVFTTGRITFLTMGLPLLTIFVLLIAGATLEGSYEGVQQYIGKWDVKILSLQPQLWNQACGQAFFSLGVGFGIMTAYASYNKRDQDVVVDAIVIAAADTFVSFIAGFAVFSILGNWAFRQGIPFQDLSSISGMSLAFVTYPVALAKLPAGRFWCALFFLTLFFLGLDSAFSMVEAVVTAVHDARKFNWINRVYILLGVCFVSLIFGVVYCLDNGLYTLDAVDFYMSTISLVFVGLLEAIAVGWVSGYQEQVAKVGAPAVVIHAWTWLFATVGGCQWGFWLGLSDGDFWGTVFAVWAVIFGSGWAYFYIDRSCMPGATDGERVWVLWMGNVEELREELNSVICPPGSKNMRIPLVWSLLIKYFACVALTVVLAITFNAHFGKYESYAEGYQAAGLLLSFLSVFFVVAGIVYPKIYDGFAPVDGRWAETEEDRVARGAPTALPMHEGSDWDNGPAGKGCAEYSPPPPPRCAWGAAEA